MVKLPKTPDLVVSGAQAVGKALPYVKGPYSAQTNILLALGEGVGDFSKSVSKIKIAQREAKYSKSKTELFQGLTELSTSLEQEHDPEVIGSKWKDGVEGLRQRLQGFGQDDAVLGGALEEYFNDQVTRASSGVSRLQGRKTTELSKAALVNEQSALWGMLSNAKSEEEVLSIQEQIEEAATRKERLGVLSPLEAATNRAQWTRRGETHLKTFRKEQNLQKAYTFVLKNIAPEDRDEYLENPENFQGQGLDLKDRLNLASRFKAEEKEAEREAEKEKKERNEAANKRLQVLHFKNELTEEAVLKEIDDLSPGQVDFYRRALDEGGGRAGSAFTALVTPRKAAENMFLRESPEASEDDLFAFSMVLQNEVEKFEAGPDGKKKRKASPMEIQKIAWGLAQTVDGYQKDNPHSWLGAAPENISREMKSALKGEGLTQSLWSRIFSKEPRVYEQRYETMFQEGVELGGTALADPRYEAAQRWLIEHGAADVADNPENIKAVIDKGLVK